MARLLPLSMILLSFSWHAHAKKLPRPTADFSATFHMDTGDGSIEGKVFHSGHRDRRDIDMSKMKRPKRKGNHMSQVMPGMQKQTVIVDHKKQVAWVLMDAHKTFMEIPLSQAHHSAGQILQPDVDIKMTKVGTEKIGTFDTTKFAVSSAGKRSKKHQSFDGHVWMTRHNIAIRIEGEGQDREGKPVPFKMWLENLKIGKQKGHLFRVPKNYKKMGNKPPPGMMPPEAGSLPQEVLDKLPPDVRKRLQQAP